MGGPVMFGNERDVEIPALLAFLSEIKPTSLLDVGAHGTGPMYGAAVKALVNQGRYEGLDCIPADRATASCLDRYREGDFLEFDDMTFDVVTCVSVLEHLGVKPATPDPLRSRQHFASNLFRSAARAVFISAPFGPPKVFEGEYSNVTETDLRSFDTVAGYHGFGVRSRFFTADTPQGPVWREIRVHETRRTDFAVLIMECVK